LGEIGGHGDGHAGFDWHQKEPEVGAQDKTDRAIGFGFDVISMIGAVLRGFAVVPHISQQALMTTIFCGTIRFLQTILASISAGESTGQFCMVLHSYSELCRFQQKCDTIGGKHGTLETVEIEPQNPPTGTPSFISRSKIPVHTVELYRDRP
jgi:hypothetical protein